MNWNEAIDAMKSGDAVCLGHWDDNEFVYLDDRKILRDTYHEEYSLSKPEISETNWKVWEM